MNKRPQLPLEYFTSISPRVVSMQLEIDKMLGDIGASYGWSTRETKQIAKVSKHMSTMRVFLLDLACASAPRESLDMVCHLFSTKHPETD
ncbi:MAG: hypothetical protein ACOZEN_15840 [Thermodesulfobacteriota bacterium]